MKFFELAIEDYAKHRKKYYEKLLHNDIVIFNNLMEQMTADGKCKGISCGNCPVRAYDRFRDENVSCSAMSPEERKKIIAEEV